MPLPDVDQDSYNAYSADQFGQQADRRIGALGFSAAADARIASLNTDYAPQPQPAPPQEPQQPLPAPDVPQDVPPVTLSETPQEATLRPPASIPSGPAGLSAIIPPASTPLSPGLSAAQVGGQDLVAAALNTADQHGIDPHLFVNLIQQESGFNPNARSPMGAQGLGQLMPDTARGLGVTDPNDPIQNLQGAARYFKQNLDRFGGDITKALAAYNAGPGAVEQYGGIPPFKETQRYVDSIMSRMASESTTNPAGGYAPGPTEGLQRVGSDLVNQQGAADISQFGDPQLTAEESYSACGPAAAVRFAQRFGRNPTLREAVNLAKTVGWTPQQGMAGLASEKAELDKMDVPSKMVSGAQWDTFSKEAQTGNPVIISTAGHYFFADGYNADTGTFHVGKSGSDLKGGAEWMTPARMTALMGQVQGGLLADNPQVPAPSIADQDSNPLGWLGRQKDALLSSLGGAVSAIGGAVSGIPETIGQSMLTQSDVNRGTVNTVGQAAGDIAGAAAESTGQGLLTSGEQERRTATQFNEFRAENFPSVLDPKHPANVLSNPNSTQEQKDAAMFNVVAGVEGGGIAGGELTGLLAKLGKYDAETRQGLEDFVTAQSKAGHDPAAIGDTVRQWMEANPPEVARSANPFQLHTEPAAGRTLLSPDQAAGHLEDLTSRYQANDAQIGALEGQLFGGGQGKIVRPTWATGWSDEGLIRFARDNNFNPYDPTWGTYAADAAKEAKGKYATAAKQTPTQIRAELARLRGENEQIAGAAEHAIDNGTGPLYRNDVQTSPQVLPWDYNAPSGTAATPAAAQESTGTVARGSLADTGVTPQGASAAPPARAPVPPAEPQLGRYPDYPAPPPEPVIAAQPADTVVQGLINEAKARGYDTTALEAQLKPPETASAGGGAGKPPVEPPPAATWDAEGNQVTGGGPPPPSAPPPGPIRAGVTPETVQVAHERIDRAYPGDWLKQQAAHDRLDRLLANGAPPDALTRFLSGEVEGKTVKPMGIVRTVRTGSMAGGLTTEGKVLLGPVIQTAMRAPVGVVKDLLAGNPGNIRAGLQGGIAGLAEGAADALQTMRYGTNYRAALTGGAEGGYGFAPGIDVMGKSALSRAAGTTAIGLVRTHGAVGDISAGIGRGAARARGATPQAAGEVGQQWAFRSGQYGTIGQVVSDALEGIKKTNPAMDVVGQVLVPFYRVGYNVLTQGVERSPVGLVGTAVDVARAKLPAAVGPTVRGPYVPGQANTAVTPVADRLANNMFGVGLATLGLTQAAQGNITGENPPAGVPTWSVKVPLKASLGPFESMARRDPAGNLYVPMRAFGPAQEALAQGAILYEAIRDGNGGIPAVAARTAEEYVGHVHDESWLRGITDALGIISGIGNLASQSSYVATQAKRELDYQVSSLGKSFIPQERLGEQISKAFGTYAPSTSSSAPTAVPSVKSTSVPAPPGRRYVPPARATPTLRARP